MLQKLTPEVPHDELLGRPLTFIMHGILQKKSLHKDSPHGQSTPVH